MESREILKRAHIFWREGREMEAAQYLKEAVNAAREEKDNGNFQQITAQNAGVFQVFALVVQIANQRFLLPIGAGFGFSCHRFVL